MGRSRSRRGWINHEGHEAGSSDALPLATTGLFQEASGAQDLQLLPDLIFDVSAAGVELREVGLEGVEVVVGEDFVRQRFDAAEDIERPAALFGLQGCAPEIEGCRVLG